MPSEKIEKIQLELMFEYADSLPVSPRVFARLNQVIRSEDTSLDYISSLVMMDPGLAAHILRVTHSAYYGAAIKVHEISSAISRIGFNEVRKIMDSIIEREGFFQAVPAYGLLASEFTDAAVDVALASETLARRVGFEPSTAFVCGLMHNIGQLAISLYHERLGIDIDIPERADTQPLFKFEESQLGIRSSHAGAALLEHWRFEPCIWQPVLNQGHPRFASSHRLGAAILCLAIWIAGRHGESNASSEAREIIAFALAELGLNPLEADKLAEETEREIAEQKGQLEMLL